jgi:Transmembrane domain of unknown function (DUF3566)
VSSPNEPGNINAPPPARPRSNGPAPLSTPDPVTDRSDVPPWERSAVRRTRKPPPARRAETSSGPHAAPGVEERINRFISGPPSSPQAPEFEAPAPAPAPAPARADIPPPARTEAPPPARTEAPPPARTEAPAPVRNEVPVRTEALRSELPDLSAPIPRPPRPRPPTRADEASRPSRLQVGARTSEPLRASMQIRRIDPWSVLKVSLMLSVALFFVWMIAVAFLYLVLGGMGVWAKLNSNVGDLLNNTSSSELVSSGTIFGSAALIGLVNIVLLTAMATIGAFIYNLTTDLVGGVEVTLADRD